MTGVPAAGAAAIPGLPAPPTGTPPTGNPPTPGLGTPPAGTQAFNHDNSACTPDEASFASTVMPILNDRCLGCHGEPTNFGAPFSLVSYGSLVAGTAGSRIVDGMLAELASGSMPPNGSIKPTMSEFQTLTSWASCGAASPAYPSGLVASQQVLATPPGPPAGTEPVYLTAGDFTVEAGTTDLYKNFRLTGRVPRNAYVRRFAPTIDNARIVHHITLHYANPDGNGTDKYLYTWAPGTGEVEFPDGGFPVGPMDDFRLEVHYNNPGGTTEVDDSGVILWIQDAATQEYAMLDPATFSIMVPARSTGTATVECVADNDFTIFGGMPHMHEIGTTFVHTVTRAGTGQTETLIELSGWSFDQQYFYSFPMDIKAGDTMTIRCDYRNDKDDVVMGGLGTTDEMCYNFMYVTPRNGSLSCPGGIFGKGLIE